MMAPDEEIYRIEQWLLGRWLRMGFQITEALDFIREASDYHRAEKMLEKGASKEQVRRCLL